MKKLITILLMALLSQYCYGQNLLINGTFDTDTSGWWAFTTLSWVSDDGAPISGNGSMRNTTTVNNNASFPAISDKFPVKPNHWYLSGLSFKVPSASPVPCAWYQFYWYDAMDTQIGTSNQVSAPFGVPNDVWQDLAGMSLAPENAATGELRIYFQTGKPGSPDPFGLWDDVFVFEETLFINGFE